MAARSGGRAARSPPRIDATALVHSGFGETFCDDVAIGGYAEWDAWSVTGYRLWSAVQAQAGGCDAAVAEVGAVPDPRETRTIRGSGDLTDVCGSQVVRRSPSSLGTSLPGPDSPRPLALPCCHRATPLPSFPQVKHSLLSGEVRGRPWLCWVVAIATAVSKFSPGRASRTVPGGAGA